jgi:hypothetical protein
MSAPSTNSLPSPPPPSAPALAHTLSRGGGGLYRRCSRCNWLADCLSAPKPCRECLFYPALHAEPVEAPIAGGTSGDNSFRPVTVQTPAAAPSPISGAAAQGGTA